ncbi:KpsF/GutQ family sugar-phosphate isomerase [Moritella sp. 24]|uniref:KpsF/GutQ family sugar-phosphate isomerase n=1 Tax=Moritella sp. 24 TaxID=2746230 RepID=UPI001BA762A0|nr:KpsF/GutQ family sugar-phosphate isomerase [Moritella sp. 24]QUM78247.1 KpsF/GutQ family sugar-phosphate isomerase [Moritella sp. 24]
MSSQFNYCQSALNVIQTEAAAITQLSQYIDVTFTAACELLIACKGKVIVTGMGKSGHIANKIAATLASTGTPAFFVHPGEASHGDLGMIEREDVVIALSNSGESDEILALYPVLKRLSIPVISMTGNTNSTMAREAKINLCIKVDKEACPLGLAPTSSTTASLVMGDAIAVALLEAKGFTANDFALSHPGGSLGRKLLLRISDIMHKGDDVPSVQQGETISNALLEVSRKGLGMTAVNDETKLVGIFTDGDLRRILDARIDIHQTPISEVMTKRCVTINEHILAAEALAVMENKKVNGLIVVNERQEPVGAFNMHDLLRAGVL